jgi:hypothetical protein
MRRRDGVKAMKSGGQGIPGLARQLEKLAGWRKQKRNRESDRELRR